MLRRQLTSAHGDREEIEETSELKVNSSVPAPVPSCPFFAWGGGMIPPGFMLGGATTSLCSFFSLFVF